MLVAENGEMNAAGIMNFHNRVNFVYLHQQNWLHTKFRKINSMNFNLENKSVFSEA